MTKENEKKRQTSFVSTATGLTKDFSESTDDIGESLKKINGLEKEIEQKEELIKKGEGELKKVKESLVNFTQVNIDNLTRQSKVETILRGILERLGDEKGADKIVPSIERVRKIIDKLVDERKDLEERLKVEKKRSNLIGKRGEFNREERWLFSYAYQTYKL
ncbi:1940_t:CDS:2, partial [Funneliformis geosporum]